MVAVPIEDLLKALQLEAHHQQRLDSLWREMKDQATIVYTIMLGMLGFTLGWPDLSNGAREALAFAIIAMPLVMLLPLRFGMERQAMIVQDDYRADFLAATGSVPPRPLITQAITPARRRDQRRRGVALMAPRQDRHL
jgi:hypothetical protein